MIEVILLSVGLSMDAFAVSIALGAKQKDNLFYLAISAGIYFGIFQAVMPLLGYLGGKGVIEVVEIYAPLIAFGLLVLIGSKMIFESFSGGNENDIKRISRKLMLTLALATSIDALAAGFALTLLDIDPFVACSIIGLTTFAFSYFGVFVGGKNGTWLESKAELLGGFVLILIGFKILLV
jgi:putative Mn2+ efflux pump MntP